MYSSLYSQKCVLNPFVKRAEKMSEVALKNEKPIQRYSSRVPIVDFF